MADATPTGQQVLDAADAELDRLIADPRRLAVLRRIELLDSAPEEAFDVMTRLATKLLKAQASFLSLVDADRDFYKSQCGFPEPLATERQLSGRTFCHYTLDRQDPLVIDDTLADPRWSDVPTVRSLGVRAYLGVPVIVRGQHVGSFCVIDTEARQWSPTEIDTAVELGRSAGREILLRERIREVVSQGASAASLARNYAELLAVVAHDLRTPLQVITLIASAMNRQGDAEASKLSIRLGAATNAMTDMVDSLLAVHAAGSRSAKLPVVVAADKLLRDAIGTVAGLSERAGIRIALGQACRSDVEVDYAGMLRVFSNLLSNCIKYCPPNSEVVLTARDEGDQVVFRVADDGPGMSAADSEHAFDRGWQGAARAAGQQGAGLGLSIVRELITQNGGQVAIDSEPGKGTTVVVSLPKRDVQLS